MRTCCLSMGRMLTVRAASLLLAAAGGLAGGCAPEAADDLADATSSPAASGVASQPEQGSAASGGNTGSTASEPEAPAQKPGTTGGAAAFGGGSFRLLSTVDGFLVELRAASDGLVRIGGGGLSPMALATAPDGRVFGVSDSIADGSALFLVDAGAGTAALVAPLSDPRDKRSPKVAMADAAFGPDGTLYANQYGQSFEVFRVDLASGFVTATPSIAIPSDMAIAADGRMFFRNEEAQLATLDAATGQVTGTIGSRGALRFGSIITTKLRTMHVAPDGQIYALTAPDQSRTDLYRIDPQTATSEKLASYSGRLTGLTSQRLQ